MDANQRQQGVAAGIVVRLLASAYDGVILFGLCFIAFIPVTAAEQALGEMPHWVKGLLLVCIAYAYFVGFWVRGGATTGMRPWKLQVAMNKSGDPLTWTAASIRFAVLMATWLALGMTLWFIATKDTGHFLFFVAASIPAMSLLTMVLSKERPALHDIISGSGVYRIKLK